MPLQFVNTQGCQGRQLHLTDGFIHTDRHRSRPPFSSAKFVSCIFKGSSSCIVLMYFSSPNAQCRRVLSSPGRTSMHSLLDERELHTCRITGFSYWSARVRRRTF